MCWNWIREDDLAPSSCLKQLGIGGQLAPNLERSGTGTAESAGRRRGRRGDSAFAAKISQGVRRCGVGDTLPGYLCCGFEVDREAHADGACHPSCAARNCWWNAHRTGIVLLGDGDCLGGGCLPSGRVERTHDVGARVSVRAAGRNCGRNFVSRTAVPAVLQGPRDLGRAAVDVSAVWLGARSKPRGDGEQFAGHCAGGGDFAGRGLRRDDAAVAADRVARGLELYRGLAVWYDALGTHHGLWLGSRFAERPTNSDRRGVWAGSIHRCGDRLSGSGAVLRLANCKAASRRAASLEPIGAGRQRRGNARCVAKTCAIWESRCARVGPATRACPCRARHGRCEREICCYSPAEFEYDESTGTGLSLARPSDIVSARIALLESKEQKLDANQNPDEKYAPLRFVLLASHGRARSASVCAGEESVHGGSQGGEARRIAVSRELRVLPWAGGRWRRAGAGFDAGAEAPRKRGWRPVSDDQ